MLWIAAAAEVSGPLLISYFIDNMVAKGRCRWRSLRPCAAYVGLQLLGAGLHTRNRCCLTGPPWRGQQLRIDVMDAALRQPLSEFDTQPVGQLISRVTNDTEVIRDLYVTVVATVLRSAALIGAMLVAMFSLDWRMALVAIAIFPAVLMVMVITSATARRLFVACALIWRINDGFNEVINGISVIQQFRRQVAFRRADWGGEPFAVYGAYADVTSGRLPATSAAQPVLVAGAVRLLMLFGLGARVY
ncbi:ABC transporter transmembrane domain-containing protein [Shigella flexneri]